MNERAIKRDKMSEKLRRRRASLASHENVEKVLRKLRVCKIADLTSHDRFFRDLQSILHPSGVVLARADMGQLYRIVPLPRGRRRDCTGLERVQRLYVLIEAILGETDQQTIGPDKILADRVHDRIMSSDNTRISVSSICRALQLLRGSDWTGQKANTLRAWYARGKRSRSVASRGLRVTS